MRWAGFAAGLLGVTLHIGAARAEPSGSTRSGSSALPIAVAAFPVEVSSTAPAKAASAAVASAQAAPGAAARPSPARVVPSIVAPSAAAPSSVVAPSVVTPSSGGVAPSVVTPSGAGVAPSGADVVRSVVAPSGAGVAPSGAGVAPSRSDVAPDGDDKSYCVESPTLLELGVLSLVRMIEQGAGLFAVTSVFGPSMEEQAFDDAAAKELRRLAFMRRLARMHEEENEREFGEKLTTYLRKREFLQSLETRHLAPNPFEAPRR